MIDSLLGRAIRRALRRVLPRARTPHVPEPKPFYDPYGNCEGDIAADGLPTRGSCTHDTARGCSAKDLKEEGPHPETWKPVVVESPTGRVLANLRP